MVQKGEITRLDDGGYRVTAGWMHHRMQVEAALKGALDRCQTALSRVGGVGWHDRYVVAKCARRPECCVYE